ncbi:MAG: tRNA (N6-threonylcarbamoyladenosine(37)-N6)-methyltransferase TrmO [Clostridia bacterium]|nr:tRNA (N6-threonylcarbamoyladenosine(37)-N6)-methyltransferase TrmO [Clostridia bacterium]MBQ6121914.1 tRNA (N6-threonylcarbamoyladenosine(37)-N6)-methyltransferase TrmO [Clostridia bacterium]MBQ6327095.1 tRNA (N6-threonylcarbamoyladenosine(37)-N6)-methyltransferase TrmO [Clostridia bacterium]
MQPLKTIATIHTDFPSKFGIPRQGGLVEALKATVTFEPEYRDATALRGLEGYSHLWLIWLFSESVMDGFSPTVKPPRLGGNRRMGVFATRSPFRPNPLGLTCVKLEGIELSGPQGPLLRVAGADLMDGTPIFDIKPYIPYADCHPEATGGFTDGIRYERLDVDFPEALLDEIPPDKRQALIEVLAQDPRPGYRHGEASRRYGVAFAGYDVRFTVEGNALTVVEVVKL